jgi:mycothiol system anti-sigma-R factor
MVCDQYRDALEARLDGELAAEEAREIDRHLATCPSCARQFATLAETRRVVSENAMRYTAPDVLKARIRGAVARSASPPVATGTGNKFRWWREIAAGVAIAIVSSSITFMAASRSARAYSEADELLASHVRSLMPGHLTDVPSTQQHTVKPWFNGRVDVSPAVPNLDKAGFPLVGGRADYVRGRVVPVVVYARRGHMINVYAWPSSSQGGSPANDHSRNGYHFVNWRSSGIEYWAVSDLNAAELHTFVATFASAH